MFRMTRILRPQIVMILGRVLLAALFAAGFFQKLIDPTAVETLLAGRGWPVWLVWPALVFNGAAAVALIAGVLIGPTALALAFYCVLTSFFHLIPSDPWQMSIFVKNWAISGGLLVLAAHEMMGRKFEPR